MFIIIINLNCWKKSPPLQSIDIIITCLATVRITLLVLYFKLIFYTIFKPLRMIIDTINEFITILTITVEFCSLWWGSLLCVFYCVKITNYSNTFFMRLKMKISKMVPWLLLISLALSFLSSFPYKGFIFHNVSMYFNGTDSRTGNDLNWGIYFIVHFAGSIIPFTIFCISVGLLIVSLLRHTRYMGNRNSGFSDAQRNIHLSVIQNMIFFLFFYVLHFLGSNLLPFCTRYKKHLLTPLCAIFYVALPSLHSISIILSNRELKNAILIFLCCS
ncbi:hypothetical protein GDO78_017595, partial [Eleutherodactylus coqui]